MDSEELIQPNSSNAIIQNDNSKTLEELQRDTIETIERAGPQEAEKDIEEYQKEDKVLQQPESADHSRTIEFHTQDYQK